MKYNYSDYADAMFLWMTLQCMRVQDRRVQVGPYTAEQQYTMSSKKVVEEEV